MAPSFGRRRFLATAFATASIGLAGCSRSAGSRAPDTDATSPRTSAGTTTGSSSTGSSSTGTGETGTRTTGTQATGDLPGSVALETLADGMGFPLDVAFAPSGDRRYVADRVGLVYVHGRDGLREEPFLDLRDSIEAVGEKGLLGIALHPRFAENRRVFVRYSAPRRPGTPEDYDHTFVLAEFEATADGGRAVRDSERTVLEIPEPGGRHNAGDIAFGPEGYLYVGVGDGGPGRDQGLGHVPDWYRENGGGNGQDVTENLLGSILRIDVDERGSAARRTGSDDGDSRDGGRAYGIPEDNPLVGKPGLDEHYAWGFRNPWRMSFDGEDLFVGDVGERLFEEVNLVEKGGNYGWNVREGTSCFDGARPSEPLEECPDSTPESVRGGEPLVDPIVEYRNSPQPTSVICGYVYRGSALPSMEGALLFGDLTPGGQLIATTRPDGDGRWPTHTIDVVEDDADELELLLSFGRDRAGELYVLGRGGEEGGLHRIVPAG